MATLLVSDIHLGSHLSRAAELLCLLKSRQWRRVIIVGDAFSDLNFSRLNRDHFILLNYLRKMAKQVRWVEGNHDAGLINVLSHVVGVKAYTEYAWEWNGKKCLAVHGHQFDSVVARNPTLTRILSFVFLEMQKVSWIRRHISMLIDKTAGKWQRLTPMVRDRAIEYAKKGGYDIVVCGHTHEALEAERDGVRYFNTGCWVGDDMHYVIFDEDHVTLKAWA
jgi:UDP-2,3-diacylglucosamine pyrophosphatase LpxH